MYKRRPAAEVNGMHVRGLTDESMCVLDEFRRSEPDLPSRPKAARRLIQQALTAWQRRAGKNAAAGVERLVRTAARKEIAAAA